MNLKPEKIELACAGERDNDFLCSVYAATRAGEIRGFGWDEVQGEAFLKMQFDIRMRSYRMQFPTAVTYIINFENRRAGSLIVDRTDTHISLTDIAVLPEFQKKGIATHLIGELQREASASRLSLTLHVDKQNENALRLYLSLGFVVNDQNDLYYSLVWQG